MAEIRVNISRLPVVQSATPGQRSGDGVVAECSRCGQCFFSRGSSEGVARRLGVLLRNSCPLRQANFYVIDTTEGTRGDPGLGGAA